MGWKDIENRSWRQPNPGLKFRGRFAIHASLGMTRYEYEDAAETFAHLGYACPAPADLLRGGIVGVATVADIVKTSDSPWFCGPRGLVIVEAEPVAFVRCGGQLGFFQWHPDQIADAPVPAKWMLPRPAPTADPQGTLL
nr:hypothetical protein [Aminobacter niigataensis]